MLYPELYVISLLFLIQSCYSCSYAFRKPVVQQLIVQSPQLLPLVAGMVTLSSAAGYWALDPYAPLLALFTLALSLSFICALTHPVAAAALLLTYLILRPWELYAESEFLGLLPKGLAILALFVWCMHSMLTRRTTLRVSWSTGILICYILWLLISAAGSGSFDHGLESIQEYFTSILALTLILENSAHKPEDVRLIMRSVSLGCVGILASATLSTYVFHRVASEDGIVRLEGIGQMGNANDLGALAALALPLICGSFLDRSSGYATRILGMILLAATVSTALLTQSRGTLLAFAAMFGIGFWFVSRWLVIKVFLLTSAVIILLAGAVFMRRGDSDLEESKATRIDMVLAGFRMARAYPLFGVGIDNFPRFYDVFRQHFAVVGQKTAHSSWILALAESGPVGLFLFALFCWVGMFRPAWKVHRTNLSIFLAVVSYGVAMSFLSHTYLIYPYILAGITLATQRSWHDSSTESVT